MYKCYTNKSVDVKMLSGLSKYMNDEHGFMKVFNVWMKMIDKNNYAYVGGREVVYTEESNKCFSYQVYFTNGTNNYCMEVKSVDNGKNEMLHFSVEPVTKINNSNLEFFAEPSYKCLKMFASYFLFPLLGTFEIHKELNIKEIMDKYLEDLYKSQLRHFNFEAQDMEKEILDYLNRPNDKMTRIGKFKYEKNEEIREISFLQFFSNSEYCYFIQQSNILNVNGEKIRIFSHYIAKELGISEASLDAYYFNNPESNYQQIRKIPILEVFSDFYKTIIFIEEVRQMGSI